MISRPNMYRILGKQFRGVKAWLLVHRPPVITRLFFALLYRLNNLMTSRRTSKDERMMNVLWKQNYHAYYADHPERCFRVETDFPVAYQSDDHLHPHGTIRDNSRNYRFNLRLYRMLGYRKDLSLLDLGCAGGGLVRSFLEDGFDAVGVEPLSAEFTRDRLRELVRSGKILMVRGLSAT